MFEKTLLVVLMVKLKIMVELRNSFWKVVYFILCLDHQSLPHVKIESLG